MSAVKNVIKDKYDMMLLKDYLRETIKDAGFSHAEIAKNPMGAKVSLFVTRPGIVIGRKGAGIRELTEKLETDYKLKNPQITVVEINKPELSPSVMCNRMSSHIERGTAFRRATMWTLKQIMDGGAMGAQITISGKLRGDRSAFEKHTAGILPRAGYHAEVIVDEDIAHVKTPMGLIGIRIRIAIKDKYIPEFELKKEKPKKKDTPKPQRNDVKSAKDISAKSKETAKKKPNTKSKHDSKSDDAPKDHTKENDPDTKSDKMDKTSVNSTEHVDSTKSQDFKTSDAPINTVTYSDTTPDAEISKHVVVAPKDTQEITPPNTETEDTPRRVKDTETGQMRDETEKERVARSESEHIEMEEEKMKELETHEDVEEQLK